MNYRGAYRIMLAAADEDDLDMAEAYIDFEENGVVDPDWTRRYADVTWTRRMVSLNDLWVSTKYDIDPDKVAAYAEMPAEEAPPILLDVDGHPLDGQHRVLAARNRGDATIDAWVPTRMTTRGERIDRHGARYRGEE